MDAKLLHNVLNPHIPPMQATLDQISAELADGYKLSNISAAQSTSGTDLFTGTGVFCTTHLIMTLTHAERRQTMHCRVIPTDQDYFEEYTRAVQEENEQGFLLCRTVPANGWSNPQAQRGLARGIYGFILFFVKTEEAAATASRTRRCSQNQSQSRRADGKGRSSGRSEPDRSMLSA